MSIWLTALKVIPWIEVIQAAPQLTKAAKNFFNKSQRTSGAVEVDTVVEEAPLSGPSAAQYQALEASLAQLLNEQKSTSEVVDALLAQNKHIVSTIEILQARMRLLLGLCVVLCFTVVVSFFWAN